MVGFGFMISGVGENRFSGIEIEFPALIECVCVYFLFFWEL